MRKQFSEEEERRRMMEGKLYLPTGEELLADQAVCLERLYEYNHTRPSQNEEREALLKEMFAEIGEGVYLEPPFHANWAGHHVHMGKNVYANFNLTHDCDSGTSGPAGTPAGSLSV